ncbi:putative sodium-dependent multivitamin transporter isoform X2 [Dermacentor albipictus]|uniref:putative sodium-dependent multivitamin transporter isoform X2 n=1 Tax=Dermacentor albipictus TaxID=60249 RepID=UPI0038FC7EE4
MTPSVTSSSLIVTAATGKLAGAANAVIRGMSAPASLDVADTVVFGVLTVAGYLIGLYFSFARRRCQESSSDRSTAAAEQEVFLGGRSLPAFALAVSVVASVATAVTVVGFVAHYYAYGFHVIWPVAGIPFAAIFSAIGMVPLLYHLRVASIFQQLVGAVGVYSAAIAVSTMYPIPLLYSSITIGLAGTVYTALGGLRSVVWADFAQAFVMFSSPFIIIGKVIYDSSSASPPLKPISDINITDYMFRTNFDVTSDENLWSGLVAAVPFSLARTAFDQMAVQRFMAAKTLGDARRIAIGGPLLVFSFFFLALATSLGLVYWYRDCDPLLSGAIKTYDQIVPHYMTERLARVTMLRGLFLAGLIGASTSTVSSVVNSHAAIFYIDVIKPHVRMTGRKAVFIMRALAFSSGTIMTLLAIAAPHIATAARLFFTFYSTASGPFAGLVLLAISSPWVNAKGAAWGTVLVCIMQLWHAIGRSLSSVAPPRLITRTLERCPPLNNASFEARNHTMLPSERAPVFLLYQASFYWMSFSGFVLTLLLGTTLSLVTGGDKTARNNVPLTSPIFLKLWARFKFFRHMLRLDDGKVENGAHALQQREREEDSSEVSPMCEGRELSQSFTSKELRAPLNRNKH